MRCFKNIGQERMPPRDRDDYVNFLVGHELVNGIDKIIHPDKIIFRIVFFQLFVEFGTFYFVFFGQLNIVVAVDIYNMQCRSEQIQHFFQGIR